MTAVTIFRKRRPVSWKGQTGVSASLLAISGESNMSRSATVRLLLSGVMLTLVLTGCSRDPNVRKQKYFESGEKYFAEGKYREAAIQYQNAVQIDDHFAQAHYQLSQSYLKLGDLNRAFPELTRTVDLAPDNYHAHLDLANLLTLPDRGGAAIPDNLKQAKAHLDIITPQMPNSPEVHEAWANYYSVQNDVTRAIGEMDQAIRCDPNRGESYLALALLDLRAKMPEPAEANLKKASEVDPKSINPLMTLGEFYQTHGRLPEAEQMFRHAIEVASQDPTPRAVLAQLLMQEGKKADAESLLRQTKKDLPDNSQAYRMLGDYYFAVGDLDKATEEYASLYNDHPNDLQVKKNYTELLILKNRLDVATRLNQQVLKANPHDTEALVYQGQIQLKQNNAAGAVETLKNALQSDSDNPLAHYQLGVAYEAQNDQLRAEKEWQEAIRLKPDLFEAQRDLASLELIRGEIDDVARTAEQMITARPYAPDGYLLKGVADLRRQRYSDAQQDANQAMQRAPQIPAPYIQLGNIQLAEKHTPEAEKFYLEALDKNSSSVEALSGLMNSYFVEKQFDKAIAAAKAQIAKAPNNSNFYDLLGTALFDGKKDLRGAESALRQAIQIDKNNADAIEKLGKVQIQEGSTDQALALYQKSIQDNPQEVRFYILSGELYESQQNWEQAKAMYQQALTVSPENALASNNLAYVLLEHGGNIDVALAMAQKARRGMPDSANAADTLGWAYFHKGIYQDAINQFQEAIRLNEQHGGTDDGSFHYHLGAAYQKLNQTSLARQQFEKAVKLNPNNADARKALSELHG
jgi:cellulose synthase operon protein C